MRTEDNPNKWKNPENYYDEAHRPYLSSTIRYHKPVYVLNLLL